MKKFFDYVDQNFDRMMEEMKEFCSHRSVAGDKTGLEETRNWIDKKLLISSSLKDQSIML